MGMTKIAFKQIKKYEDAIRDSSKRDPFEFVNIKEQKIVKNHSSSISKPNVNFYRQGDILFKKIISLPSQLTEKKDKIVAEGEATGHAHVLSNGALFESLEQDSKLFIEAGKTTRIIHEEHLPIKLEAGSYEVIRQREYLGPGLQKRIVRD